IDLGLRRHVGGHCGARASENQRGANEQNFFHSPPLACAQARPRAAAYIPTGTLPASAGRAYDISATVDGKMPTARSDSHKRPGQKTDCDILASRSPEQSWCAARTPTLPVLLSSPKQKPRLTGALIQETIAPFTP